MQNDIKHTWHFQQSPQEVWEYLTKPELIEQWLMKCDLRPIKGHKFQFTFTPKKDSKYEGIVHCEVLEADPFTKLSYSWNGNTQNGDRSFKSKVVWTLIPKDNGTELQLVHSGFIVLEDYITHNNGWNACLTKMTELLNSSHADKSKLHSGH